MAALSGNAELDVQSLGGRSSIMVAFRIGGGRNSTQDTGVPSPAGGTVCPSPRIHGAPPALNGSIVRAFRRAYLLDIRSSFASATAGVRMEMRL